jgi:AsmA protein
MSGLGQLAGIKTGNDTTIQTFSSNVNVTPAFTRADNINLIMPAFGHVTGTGTIANQNLNFKMVATVQTTGAGLLGAAGGKAGSQNVPFAIEGTTSNPRFIPDTSALVQNAIQQQLNQRLGGQAGANPNNNLGGALGGLFGGRKKKH